jgi:hypothetical protein
MNAVGVANSLQNCYVSSERQFGFAGAKRTLCADGIKPPLVGRCPRLDLGPKR